jgi:hypothetical protein
MSVYSGRMDIKRIGFPRFHKKITYELFGWQYWSVLIEWKNRILVIGYIMGLADPFCHQLKAF